MIFLSYQTLHNCFTSLFSSMFLKNIFFSLIVPLKSIINPKKRSSSTIYYFTKHSLNNLLINDSNFQIQKQTTLITILQSKKYFIILIIDKSKSSRVNRISQFSKKTKKQFSLKVKLIMFNSINIYQGFSRKIYQKINKLEFKFMIMSNIIIIVQTKDGQIGDLIMTDQRVLKNLVKKVRDNFGAKHSIQKNNLLILYHIIRIIKIKTCMNEKKQFVEIVWKVKAVNLIGILKGINYQYLINKNNCYFMFQF
ncbi:unnamed protein product [Paramecium primaurelia]|uniref:Uncharacterized protein n=1 Tax=Paramecium primaurelia TaxID=5886 RepID=A0A8S1NEN6_PARPR|nr:unnamed protein product [Paramecium primaurelia]